MMADYTDLDTVRALGTINQELEAMLRSGQVPAPPQLDDLKAVRVARAERNKSLAEIAHQDGTVSETLIHIPVRDGYLIDALVHRRLPLIHTKTPLVVLWHGGGFIFGTPHELCSTAHALAALHAVTVVCPAYRPAPEHPFPTAAHDAWDALLWITANTDSLSVDPSLGFVIGGVASGANLAAVCAQKSLTEGLTPPLSGLQLNLPCVLSEEIVPTEEKHLWVSREQNVDSPGLNTKTMAMLLDAYQPDNLSSEWSPFNASDPHRGMPPVHIQVSGLDPLRDDGLVYERVLRRNGVLTKLDVYPGVPHGHYAMLPNLALSQKAIVDSILGIAWLLKQTQDVKEKNDSGSLDTVDKYSAGSTT